jgi:hypothetical protein
MLCREVVKDLLKRGVRVKALVKDSVKANQVLPKEDELDIVKGNVYQYADVARAVKGVDAIICSSSATDRTDPLGPFSVDYTVMFSAWLGESVSFGSWSLAEPGELGHCLAQYAMAVLRPPWCMRGQPEHLQSPPAPTIR